MNTTIHEQHAHFPHWYLQFIGVGREFQGKGFVGENLMPMLARMDAERASCFLETQNQENVPIFLPLAYANRWAIQASALLSGIGIGLFIDEVGKFITQTNDYFFPPALSLIYGFFLLNVFVYLYFRRPPQEDPREAMYHIFEGLRDVLDGDLDTQEAARIESQLAIAKGSDREEIVSLANAISTYLQFTDALLLFIPVFGDYRYFAPINYLTDSVCLSPLVLE